MRKKSTFSHISGECAFLFLIFFNKPALLLTLPGGAGFAVL